MNYVNRRNQKKTFTTRDRATAGATWHSTFHPDKRKSRKNSQATGRKIKSPFGPVFKSLSYLSAFVNSLLSCAVIILTLTLITAGSMCLSPAALAQEENEEVMHFPDRNLEAAVRDNLDQQEGVLTPEDMERLNQLEAGEYEIDDLTGLEYAVNLESLVLYDNQIDDLSPLSELEALRSLNLYHNRVSDLAPLSGLTDLESLLLGGNRVRDLSSLATLTGLTELYLFENQVRNISTLKELDNLERLNLNQNRISDLSPLEELAGNLTRLSIQGNRYDNLTALEQLTNLEYLELGNKNITDISQLAELTGLEQLSITATNVSDMEALQELSSLEWLSLEDNQISEINPLSALTGLEYLNVNENEIQNIDAIAELENLEWLEIRNNYLDLDDDTPAMTIIEELLERDAKVSYEPQLRPRYRGDGSVRVPEGSSGKRLQTPIRQRFTVLNHEKGWRIQSFTVEHQDGMPLDYLREVGRLSPGAGRFAWHSTSGQYRPNVEEDFPHTITFNQPAAIQLGLSVQIWPGYPGDDERLFYISEVTLWNIETENYFTIELDPPEDREEIEPAPEPDEAEEDVLQIEEIE